MKLVFLILLLSVGTFAQSGDFGLWNDVQITHSVNKKVDIFGGAKIETRKNNKEIQEQRYYGGVLVKQRNWTFQGSYIAVELAGNYWEHRPVITVGRKFTYGKSWTITPRFRTEYRIRPAKNDFRFVPTVTVERKLDKKHKAYFTGEFYSDRRKNDTSNNRKRLFFGVNRVINKSLSVDMFYLYQRDVGVLVKNTNKLGLTWKFRF